MKKCKCGETDVSQFSLKNYRTCKACRKLESDRYKLKNADKIKEADKKQREKNREKNRLYAIEYYKNNKELCNENSKEYHKNNKDRASELNKQYNIDNKELLSEKKKQRYLDNREENIEYARDYQKKLKLGIAEEKIASGNNGGDWIFYICEFKNKDNHFFKYGITSLDTKTRFNRFQYKSYIITYHREIFGSEDYIKGLERKVLIETKKDLYISETLVDFDGHTECRTKIDLDLVEALIN